MTRSANAEMANSGTKIVVTFMPYCGRSVGTKNMPCSNSPSASPHAAGAAPKIRNRVEPKMKCTSETPTEKCGRTSKKQNTSTVVAAARNSGVESLNLLVEPQIEEEPAAANGKPAGKTP